MRFVSAISGNPDTRLAVEELLDPVDERITPGMVDVVFFFTTAHHRDEIDIVLGRMEETFQHAVMVGCSAYGTIGCDSEIERSPSMSLLVGSLPDVRICPFKLRQRELLAAEGLAGWERIVGSSPESAPTFIALGDPFKADINRFVDQLNTSYPGAPLFGGIASASVQPGQNMLFLNGEVLDEGIVGVSLTGNLIVKGAVSQGCRPIGKHFVITRGERNVIYELGGRPPLAQLEGVLSGLSVGDKGLAKESLFIGRVIDEYKKEFARGDFLIHNITGADRRSGAIAIAGPVNVGSTVQFHVRDAASADDDLRQSLAPYAASAAKAALLFSCNGRGTQLYSDPDHDVGVCRQLIGDIPVAGFFCGGEFGPIGGRNFVHGFTASIAMFHERCQNHAGSAMPARGS